MADITIKKYVSGTGWTAAYPETTVGQIVATGTPGSTTFLRGDGVWATPAASGGSGYGLKLTGTISANQTLESLFETAYDNDGLPDAIGSYWVVTAANATVTFITTAQTHGSPTIYYCLIGDFFEENDATGQFTLEKHDWLMITSYTGSGTSGSPYVVKFSVINNTYTAATATQYGIVKYVSNTAQSQAANTLTATAGRTYAVQKDSNGDMVVNVPWTDTDTNTTYSAGTGITLSGTTFSADLIDTTLQSVTANAITTTANRTYAVMPDADGDLVVNVPWVDTDTNTTYSQATSSTLGLVKIGFTESGKDYPVELNASGQMFVNVPWVDTDTNTTYGIATSTTAGLVEVFSDTDQTVAANAVTATAGRTYGIQLNAANQMVVNVPWVDTDTNTTYTAGTGLSLTGTVFANTAPDQTVALTGAGSVSVSGTYPNFTITGTDTNTTYGLAGTATSGLVRLGATAANVTVNGASSTAGRYYPVGASTSGNLYVNVPWVDTNTTYSLGSFGITATAAELNALDGITATVTELNYTDGVTSNIQTQLNGKASSIHNHSATEIVTGELNTARLGSGTATAGLVLKSDGDGTASWQSDNNTTYSLGSFGITATSTELNYTDGVTSNIQTQLDGKAATSHTHSNYLPIAGAPYYSPDSGDILRYNTTYGWLTEQPTYGYELIRNHTNTTILDDTGAFGTTGGTAAVTVSLAAGDVLMIELSPYNSIIAGYTVPIIKVRLGGTDTTPTSTTQTTFIMDERVSSTTRYQFNVKISGSSTVLYFDDSFRMQYLDTSTASSIMTEASAGLFIGKVWRLHL